MGYRIDHDSIDEHPYVVAFNKTNNQQYSGFIEHGDWDDRTTPVPQEMQRLMSASGITVNFSFSRKPIQPIGTLQDLNNQGILNGYEKSVYKIEGERNKQKKLPYNSDGLINCLLQPGQFYLRIQKSMREEFNPLIKSCGTRTDSAAETNSIGLQADARVVMVFASPPRQFYRDMTNPAHLPGPRHLDSFIVTPNARPLIGTLQKHMPTLTRTATHQTAGPLVVTQVTALKIGHTEVNFFSSPIVALRKFIHF